MLNRTRAISALLLVNVAAMLCGQSTRPTITEGVTIDQKLDAPVPLDLPFRDEANRLVSLRQYFGQKPVVLALVYFRCPNLCNLTLNETASSLKRVPLIAGKDYDVLAVSFDPAETPELALAKKETYAKQDKSGTFRQGWHFLTGSQQSISRLTEAVGFHYRWDERTKQFVHAGGVMIVTPQGRLSRYFYGVQFAPADMRLSLVDASHNRIGSPMDHLLLFCFHYDATQGKYTLAILNLLKVAGCLTVLALAALLYYLMRKPRQPPADSSLPHNDWEAGHVR